MKLTSTGIKEVGLRFFDPEVRGHEFDSSVGLAAQIVDHRRDLPEYGLPLDLDGHSGGNIVLQYHAENAAGGDDHKEPHQPAREASTPVEAGMKQHQQHDEQTKP